MATLHLHYIVDEDYGEYPDYLFYSLPDGKEVDAERFNPIEHTPGGEDLVVADSDILEASLDPSIGRPPLLFIFTEEGFWYILSASDGVINLVIGEDANHLAGGIYFFEIFNVYPYEPVNQEELDALDSLMRNLVHDHQGLYQLGERAQTLYDENEIEYTFGLSTELATLVIDSEHYYNSL